MSPKTIPIANTYRVTLEREGEPFPESHCTHLLVGFKL